MSRDVSAPPLMRLLYRSEIALTEAGEALDRRIGEIAEQSRVNNRDVGVTGALMVAAGAFVQAVEGPPDAVEATFERICRDLRHRRVQLLELVEVEDRAFGEWAMAIVAPRREFVTLGLDVDATAAARSDAAASAAATIRLMRALVLGEAGAANGEAQTAA